MEALDQQAAQLLLDSVRSCSHTHHLEETRMVDLRLQIQEVRTEPRRAVVGRADMPEGLSDAPVAHNLSGVQMDM